MFATQRRWQAAPDLPVCKQEVAPAFCVFFLLEEKAATREQVTRLAGGPLYSHWPARSDGVHAHQGPLLLPTLRARAPGLKDTDPQEGPACCRSDRGKWVIPAYIAPGCVLDMICLLPPFHSLFHGVMGDWSSFPRSPLLALSATWW